MSTHSSLGAAVKAAVHDLLVLDPDEVTAIAARWEHAAEEVGRLAFDPPRRIAGTSSTVIAALHTTGDRAASAADMLAAQLRFTATTCRRAAAELSATDESSCPGINGAG
ncbi:hypothetical protein GII33_10870 [Gordonia pseudamarae]|jgi:hypothetical protein|uniref:HNH endonuclease n=1 Tax=Gordonia pseudamarae TaxID=2831662 RepID=A0ABX6IJ33_9ACTN|nr:MULTISPECIES: hypothetical protein [Gordonia]MBD0022416.1 hypothetical protein [Gordonia sp. (in: high G+C Gram-positive bacteria)]QHN26394.1 hypothetical protein GII33_10870 [Gordonia pseudamarae]QHN35290.1 hypothetical protein GII31_10690 [Gordonia pseudamarae]